MRIDNLPVGSTVTLRFHGSFGNSTYDETVKFLGIEGTGDNRRANFRSPDGLGDYEWQAYRFQGRWVYGSSADRLQLLNVEK